MTTQAKIVLLLSSIFLTHTAIFSIFIYYSISNYAYNDFYKRLEIRAITTAKIELENVQDINAVKEIRLEYLEKLPDEKIEFIDLSTTDLKNESNNLNIPKSFINDILNNERAFYKKNETYYSGIRYKTIGKDYMVVASAQNYYSTHHIVYLRNLLILALVVSILLIGIISYLFSRKVMLPVRRIIKEMKKISTENLNYRLYVPTDNNELASLTSTFNTMLNRLETSFESQKNFVSNASHELNTPLTSIIGEADVSLSKTRSPEEYIKTLNTILCEAEKLDKKTKALLFLAQSGYDGKTQKFKTLRIDELILEVKDTVGKIYPNVKIKIDFSLLPENSEKLKITGNDQLLHLAISNILLNACKYNLRNDVTIALAVSNKNVIISVKDQGIGIPESEIPYIYDPFFRASNTREYEGYGIGLPLARNVVYQHNGFLEINSEENIGTTVEIKLPTRKF